MKIENMKKIKEIAKIDLSFNDDNLHNKLAKHPVVCQKWLDLLMSEKRNFIELQKSKEKKFSELYHYYKFKYDFKLDSKSEIEIYIKGNKQYDIILEKYNESVVIIELLDETLKNIRNMGFSMKHYLDLKVFLSGA